MASSNETKLAEIEVVLPNLGLSIAAVITQLGAMMAAVVLGLMHLWLGVGISIAVYALATSVRLLQRRQRGRLELYDDRVSLVERKRTRSWRWDAIALSYGVLRSRDSAERVRLVPLGEHTLAPFEELLRARGLEAARQKLANGESLTLFAGKLVVHTGGLERARVFTAWPELRVRGDEQLMTLLWTDGESGDRLRDAEPQSSLAVPMSSGMVPDFAIVRELLREHAVEIAPAERKRR